MKKYLTLLLMLLFSGCVAKSYYVPSGTYVSKKTGEKITIKGKKIIFYLKDKRLSKEMYIKEFNHSYHNYKSRISISPVVSTEKIIGIYAFYWDGEKIIRDDIKKKVKTSFIKD